MSFTVDVTISKNDFGNWLKWQGKFLHDEDTSSWSAYETVIVPLICKGLGFQDMASEQTLNSFPQLLDKRGKFTTARWGKG